MSLKTRFKNLGKSWPRTRRRPTSIVLESPVLTTGMYERMSAHGREAGGRHRLHHAAAGGRGTRRRRLRANLDRVRAEAEDAALRGCGAIVLTDEASAPSASPCR